MTPRPIHRWKTFWLGIFVLAFLAWAWAFSIDRVSELHTTTPYLGRVWLMQFDGEVGVFHFATDSPPTWYIWAYDNPGITDPASKKNWRHAVSHYAHLIIAFLLTWSVFLIWRWRKEKHLTEPSHQPEASP